MPLRTLDDIDLRGGRPLVRVDYNVPLSDGAVADPTRIVASLPTLRRLVDAGAHSLVLMSHLGRPKGKRVAELSLAPVCAELERQLQRPVAHAADCIGDEVERLAAELPAGGVLLLENLRFHPEEEANDDQFAAALARLGSVFVNDAFGAAHRAHASTVGVASHLPAVAGLLLQREVEVLGSLLADAKSPFVAIIGGAKVSSKLAVLQQLMEVVDVLVIGGAMAYTFLAARGVPVGASLVEPDLQQTAASLLSGADGADVEVLLPVDHVVATAGDHGSPRTTEGAEISAGDVGLDIGPRTAAEFASRIGDAATVLWNGPVGMFEEAAYAAGTEAVAAAVAGSAGVTVVGGGDSVAALNAAGAADRITHVSTGGGASLELLEGRELPGVAVLTT